MQVIAWQERLHALELVCIEPRREVRVEFRFVLVENDSVDADLEVER